MSRQRSRGNPAALWWAELGIRVWVDKITSFLIACRGVGSGHWLSREDVRWTAGSGAVADNGRARWASLEEFSGQSSTRGLVGKSVQTPSSG